MKPAPYERLEDVIQDPVFPEVDLALRQGRHVDSDDVEQFTFLDDAQEFLEPFYRRFGCELVKVAADGYFYLLPINERLGRRHLSAAEMLVGQALALFYLDPSTVQSGGLVPRAQLVGRLEGLVGRQKLLLALNPRRRKQGKYDERVAEENVRLEIDKALRTLAALGFVELIDDRLRIRAPALRFADPVRGIGDRTEAMERLVAEGKVARSDAMTPDEEEEDS